MAARHKQGLNQFAEPVRFKVPQRGVARSVRLLRSARKDSPLCHCEEPFAGACPEHRRRTQDKLCDEAISACQNLGGVPLALCFSSLALPSPKRTGSISALLDLLNDEPCKLPL